VQSNQSEGEMKLSEQMQTRITFDMPVDDETIEDWADEVAQLEAESRQLRRIIEVNAPDVDIEYNLSQLNLSLSEKDN